MWLELQRQAHAQLRAVVYSPVSAAEAQTILQSRKLGIASLRLLPKKSGNPSPQEHRTTCTGSCLRVGSLQTASWLPQGWGSSCTFFQSPAAISPWLRQCCACPTGMRPIVNLGKASRITFRAAGGRRSRVLPAQQTVMSFRPVNHHLQRLHRVTVTSELSPLLSESIMSEM